MEEEGVLRRSKGEILQRWIRFFGTLLSATSPTLNPVAIEEVKNNNDWQHRSLGIRYQLGQTNAGGDRKNSPRDAQLEAPGHDSLPVKPLKIDGLVEKSFPHVLVAFSPAYGTERGGALMILRAIVM